MDGLPDGRVVLREPDGVVEGETEGLVDLLTALPAVEEVRLDVLKDGEEHAARRMSGDVAVGAGDALGDGRCTRSESMIRWRRSWHSPLATVARVAMAASFKKDMFAE